MQHARVYGTLDTDSHTILFSDIAGVSTTMYGFVMEGGGGGGVGCEGGRDGSRDGPGNDELCERGRTRYA